MAHRGADNNPVIRVLDKLFPIPGQQFPYFNIRKQNAPVISRLLHSQLSEIFKKWNLDGQDRILSFQICQVWALEIIYSHLPLFPFKNVF